MHLLTRHQQPTLRPAKLLGTLAIFLSVPAHAGTTTLSVADATKGTSKAPATILFPLTRSGDLAYDTLLNYHTIDGTAVAGTDYTAVTSSLLIPAGTTAAEIPVLLNAQTGNGADLTFQLQLDSAIGVGPAPSFAAQQTFTTGSGPQSVVFADINNDGKADAVVANGNAGTVSVLLNTTAPGATTLTFAAHQDFTTGSAPFSVMVADINGDGKPDLITANDGSNSVSVLLNTTTAGSSTVTFAAQQSFPMGTGPTSVTVADVNGDGKPDLIVTNIDDNNVSLLLNTTAPGAATPSFAARQNFATGQLPNSAAVADINGDGKPDLIVANDLDGTFSVLLNATSPSFAPQQTFPGGSFPISVTTADVNGDGKADVILTNNNNQVTVMINTTTPGSTTPTFAAQQAFATGANPQFATAVDVNGDGKPDLIVTNFNDSTVSVLLNTTAPGSSVPSFAAQQTFATGSGTFTIAAGDVNGDGKPDLAAVNHNSSTLSLLLNTTASPTAVTNFAAQQSFATDAGPSAVIAADFDGDGIVDVATTNSEMNSISVLRGTTVPGSATPTFAAQQTFATGGDPVTAVAGHFSRSGRLDIAVVNNASNTVSVFDNISDASGVNFATPLTFAVGQGPNAIVTYDVNGDGLPDLVVSNFADNTISVLLNTSTGSTASFAAQQTFAATTLPNALAVGDINHDGKLDVIVTSFTGNVVAVMLNTTAAGSMTAAFSSPQSFATGTDPNAVVVGDFNGDGILDIATANNISNNVSVLLGTTPIGATTVTFAAAVNFTVGIVPIAISAADIDGDGRLDLLVANYATNTVSLLRNTTAIGATTPAFDAQPPFATGSSPAAVTTTDIDGDGRPDIVTANQQGASISVLMNSQYRAAIATPAATGTIVHDLIFGDGFE